MDRTALSQACLDVSQRAFPYGSPWSKEHFAEFFDGQGRKYELEWDKDKLVGFCLWSHILDEAELLLLCVDPDYQGVKIGETLLQRGMKQLESFNIKRFFLEVRSSNDRAYDFYNNQGFNEIGNRKHYYQNPTEDAILMGLER